MRGFLPQLQKSNQELEEVIKNSPDSVDIENVDEEGPHIEFNLAVGIDDVDENNPEENTDNEILIPGNIEDESNADVDKKLIQEVNSP